MSEKKTFTQAEIRSMAKSLPKTAVLRYQPSSQKFELLWGHSQEVVAERPLSEVLKWSAPARAKIFAHLWRRYTSRKKDGDKS